MSKQIKVTCKPIEAYSVVVGDSRRMYRSKKTARRKVAWSLLYNTGRLAVGNVDETEDVTFCDPDVRSDWAHKRYQCECCDHIDTAYGAIEGVDSSACALHNRHNGYYKRLHSRIVRWLELGYIAPDSGLAK